jgi:hypothetical protein
MGGGPPPIDTSELPPEEETEDWKDWGPEENARGRISGNVLNESTLRQRLTGQTLSGCYANGEAFSEVLREDGSVLDPSTGQVVAKYGFQSGEICFAYPEQRPACYTVTDYEGDLLFYSSGGFRGVAASTCPIPRGAKGFVTAAN